MGDRPRLQVVEQHEVGGRAGLDPPERQVVALGGVERRHLHDFDGVGTLLDRLPDREVDAPTIDEVDDLPVVGTEREPPGVDRVGQR
ncbi:hypothetical protein GCM10027355_34010 [Haloplanus salinarum]